MPYLSVPTRTRGPVRDVRLRPVTGVAILAAYALAVQIGLDLHVPAFRLSGFWIGTGLLVATIGRLPARTWSLALPALFGTNLAIRLAAGQPLSDAWLLVSGDVVDFLVATFVLRRLLGTASSFSRPLGVLWAGLAVGTGAAASAAFGALAWTPSEAVASLGSGSVRAGFLWFVGRLLGGVVLLSLVDAWRLREPEGIQGSRQVSAIEIILVSGVVLFSGGIGPWVPVAGSLAAIAIGAIRTVALVWLPVRVGRRATTTVLALLVYSYASLTITGQVAPFGLRLIWVNDIDTLTLGTGTSEVLLSLVTVVVMMLVLASLFADRRRTVREARTAELRFRAIAESTNDALIVADGTHRITFANPAASVLLLRTDLIGSSLTSLLPEQLRSAGWTALLAPSPEGPVNRRAELTFERADGHQLAVEVAIASYEVAEGGRAYTVVARDQSERLQTESALRRSAADLERSNQDLAEFAYIASHDLQEPLRMVASFLRLLEDRYKGRLDDTADQFIGYAVDGAERLNALVSDLLRYSRAGTTAVERSNVELSEVAQGALELLRVQVRESGARIQVDELPVVSANATLVTQVMQNLLSNAMKFHVPGVPPDIRVTSRGGGRAPVIVIEDHGIGIPADQRDAVFQPFKRLHARESFSGNGIGLSVCRKIIERHGGAIWLEDTPGGGTTVCFQLQAALRRIA